MKPELLEKLFESDVKLGKAIIIHDAEAQSSELDDLFYDIDDEKMSKLLGVSLEHLKKAEKLKYVDELMVEKLAGKLLCEVHTPIKTKVKGSTSLSSFSWGYTTYTYIAADSLDELAEKACEWADKQEVREKSP
jgi:hypothetical protein